MLLVGCRFMSLVVHIPLLLRRLSRMVLVHSPSSLSSFVKNLLLKATLMIVISNLFLILSRKLGLSLVLVVRLFGTLLQRLVVVFQVQRFCFSLPRFKVTERRKRLLKIFKKPIRGKIWIFLSSAVVEVQLRTYGPLMRKLQFSPFLRVVYL